MGRRHVVLVVCATTSCLLVKDLDPLTGDDGAAPADATVGPDTGPGIDAATASSSGGNQDDAGADATPDAGPCPATTRGPTLVSTPLGFCIDATEVTQRHYGEFLAAVGGDTSNQEARCASNGSFAPARALDGDHDDYPVQGIDFCDAVAFCNWSGKHLCGSRDGTPLDYTERFDATRSQWFAACSANADGLHKFPYGNVLDEAACNGKDRPDAAAGVLPAGALASCQGGYAGVFDLAGNLAEWQDSCQTTDAGTLCSAPGGAYFNSGVNLYCDHVQGSDLDPTDRDDSLGIRCCAR